ncbi:MAG: ABC transporter permease [Candidatus Bathyarchaeota archaeon]|nr:MAG: ABC transporter permease [Candidatus Bathyarchaeota archaeon]
MALKGVRDKIFSTYFVLFMIFTYTPLIALMVFSFNNSTTLGLPFKGFTLRWYQQFFASSSALNAIKNSFILASGTAILATLGGLTAAFALVRHRFIGRTIFQWFMLLPMVLPYLIIGIALLMFFSRVNIKLSLGTVMIGHTLVALPFTTLIMVARLIGFDRSLEEAAMDLGADELTTFRKITLPLIMPGIVAAAFLAFTTSFEDASIAFFLLGTEQNIPIFIYGQLRYPKQLPMLTAMSVATLSIALVLALLSWIIEKIETR